MTDPAQHDAPPPAEPRPAAAVGEEDNLSNARIAELEVLWNNWDSSARSNEWSPPVVAGWAFILASALLDHVPALLAAAKARSQLAAAQARIAELERERAWVEGPPPDDAGMVVMQYLSGSCVVARIPVKVHFDVRRYLPIPTPKEE